MPQGSDLAGGAMQQGAAPQGVAPQGAQGAAPQVAPGAAPQGVDQQLVIQALQQGIQASVNNEGFVDVQKLAQIWPQIAQQVGLNIPFETVLQMIQQNPAMISDLIMKLGLNGIIANGRQLTVDQLTNIGRNPGNPAQG